MNILRHKSWHVRNRNNITRVRRDEEKALQEEKEVQRRIDLADSQARLQVLRQRVTTHKTDSDGQTSGAHLDVFEDYGDKVTTKNAEHDKETKEETERFEKKTGILQYLVDKEKDAEHNWYLDSHEKRMKLNDSDGLGSEAQKVFKDNNVKKFNDPIEDMRRYLEAMKPKTKDKSKDKSGGSSGISKDAVKTVATSDDRVRKSKSKKSKKAKKHKKKHKRRRNSSSSESSDDNKAIKVSKTIEQLRAERLERERKERERTRTLLYGKTDTKDEVVLDDRRRTYNSQFNPEIARQNQTDQQMHCSLNKL